MVQPAGSLVIGSILKCSFYFHSVSLYWSFLAFERGLSEMRWVYLVSQSHSISADLFTWTSLAWRLPSFLSVEKKTRMDFIWDVVWKEKRTVGFVFFFFFWFKLDKPTQWFCINTYNGTHVHQIKHWTLLKRPPTSIHCLRTERYYATTIAHILITHTHTHRYNGVPCASFEKKNRGAVSAFNFSFVTCKTTLATINFGGFFFSLVSFISPLSISFPSLNSTH